MLSDRNVRAINDQIENELSVVDSLIASNEDKIAALDRIVKLKALLTPQPSREDILAELANAIVEAQRNPPATLADDLISGILGHFRSKH